MAINSTIYRLSMFAGLLLLVALAANPASPPSEIDEDELARRLTNLEKSAADSPPGAVRDLVRRFANEMIHAKVRVHSARVIATYKRIDWKTRPYFAVNYTPDDYVYLDEFDQDFQDELANNLHWVSVVKSLPDRQLMFELAIDETTFEKLEAQEVISFSCELAGVIRGGKSVYSRMISFE